MSEDHSNDDDTGRDPDASSNEKTGEGTGRKSRLIREEVKDQHTSHWDLDYVSHEELERLMMQNRAGNASGTDQSDESSTKGNAGHDGEARPDGLNPDNKNN